jgi:hypothetical protein
MLNLDLEVKDVPVKAVKTRETESTAPLIFNLGTRWR